MIPWGTDETFESNEHIAFDGQAGVLFDKCIEDQACLATYWHSLTTALAAARQLDLPARAATLDALLASWQVQEQSDGRHPYSRAEAHGSAVETAEYTTLRVGEAEAWLAAHVPPAEPGSGGGPGSGSGSTGTSSPSGSTGSGGQPTQAQPDPPRLRRLRASGTSLRTEIVLTTPETVSQRATFYVDGKRHMACTVPAHSHAIGDATLECRLSVAARAALRTRPPLRLYVVTTVHSEGGATSVFERRVTLTPR